MGVTTVDAESTGRQERILQAVIALLAERGITGVSMRAVAARAEVSLGLLSYHYADKVSLISAALRRIEEQDLALVEPDPTVSPERRLRAALRLIAAPEYLTTAYLSLRLQLWSLAAANPAYEQLNAEAQRRYRQGLAALIRAARPELGAAESRRRAADIDVLQNGLWLTTLLGLDRASIKRCVRRCEEIALAD
ncbi:MAG: TetR/AcrR family transcriptional regulator [Nocardioides sp.]